MNQSANLVYCTSCGTQSDASKKYCAACGNAIEASRNPILSDELIFPDAPISGDETNHTEEYDYLAQDDNKNSAPEDSHANHTNTSDKKQPTTAMGFPVALMWLGVLLPLIWILGLIWGGIRFGRGGNGAVYFGNMIASFISAVVVRAMAMM